MSAKSKTESSDGLKGPDCGFVFFFWASLKRSVSEWNVNLVPEGSGWKTPVATTSANVPEKVLELNRI